MQRVLPHGLLHSFAQALAKPDGKRHAPAITEQGHNVSKGDVMHAASATKTEMRIDLSASAPVEVAVEIGRQLPAGPLAEGWRCRRYGKLDHCY